MGKRILKMADYDKRKNYDENDFFVLDDRPRRFDEKNERLVRPGEPGYDELPDINYSGKAFPDEEIRFRCPLLDEEIERVECIDVQLFAEDILTSENLSHRFRERTAWRELCKNCTHHIK